MSRILIETIPHTGTRFLAKLFYKLGLKEVSLEELQNPTTKDAYTIRHFPLSYADRDIPCIKQRVTMLRDPHLVAISNMRGYLFQESIGVDIERLNDRYDTFIHRVIKRKYVYADLDCPAEKRKSHLVAVLKQLNIYNDSHLNIVKQYANNWTSVGRNDNHWKQEYIETGRLPDCIRRCDLQRAITWNEKLKQECIYDNIT